jgi:hypothetical protein
MYELKTVIMLFYVKTTEKIVKRYLDLNAAESLHECRRKSCVNSKNS